MSPAEVFRARTLRRLSLFLVLVVLLVAVCTLSVMIGQYRLPIRDLPAMLAVGPTGVSTMAESVLWQIRMPRVVLGVLVGAALGVSGALMQAVFANPLAEPSVIGVTSGAGVGAAAAIVFGWSFMGTSTIAASAFITAIFTVMLVTAVARLSGSVRVITLILVGIAVNAVAGAAISFLTFLAPSTSRDQIVFWQMGTLNGSMWAQVNIMAIVAVVGILGSILIASQLDVLALGDNAARHVGINVQRVRTTALTTATILTAAAVAYAGLIGFVGLIIPHIIRTVIGPTNRLIVPASALGGAVLLVGADILARTVIPFADLPIGIFTALVGGPVFFYLLWRMNKNRELAR